MACRLAVCLGVSFFSVLAIAKFLVVVVLECFWRLNLPTGFIVCNRKFVVGIECRIAAPQRMNSNTTAESYALLRSHLP